MSRSRVLAFDVNETLLDVGALDPLFAEVFGAASWRRVWFGQMLQLAMLGGLTGAYADFSSCQGAALEMVAAQAEVQLPPGTAERLLDGMRALPPHDDVAEALDALAGAGFRVMALTNSPLPVVQEQLRRAALSDRFELIASADQVGALKPAPAPYQMAARAAGVPVGRLRLVAAHGWDVSGALAAGCAAAFLVRSPAVPNPLGPQPDVTGVGLAEVARGIIAHDA